MSIRRFLLFAAVVAWFAHDGTSQTLTLTGTSVRPNQPATINLTLAGTGSADIAGIQWTLTLPTGVTLVPATGAGSTTAGKVVYCGFPTSTVCLAVGLNATKYADGVVATYSFTPTTPGTLNFSLSNTLAASSVAAPTTVTGGPPLGFLVLSPCDLNSDGKTDNADLQISIAQVLGTQTCGTADLDQDGRCTIWDVMRLVVAAAGGQCRVGP